MNDFDYDCREKKRIAQNARHMKNGSKSRKCSLSTDRMTESQWRKKNGEVKVMDMNKPMSYGQLREMSTDLQKEYIEKMIARFGCNLTALAKFFGLDNKGINKLCDELRIDRSRFGRGVRMSKEQTIAFSEWCDAEMKRKITGNAERVATLPAKVVETHEDRVIIVEKPTPTPKITLEKNVSMKMSKVAASFAGQLNMEQIQKFLNYATDGKPAYITITVGELRNDG